MNMRDNDGVASIAVVPVDGDPADQHGSEAQHAAQELDAALGGATAALHVGKKKGDGHAANGDSDGN